MFEAVLLQNIETDLEFVEKGKNPSSTRLDSLLGLQIKLMID